MTNVSKGIAGERTRAFGFYKNACDLLGYEQEFFTEEEVATEENWKAVYARASELGFKEGTTGRDVALQNAVLAYRANNGLPKVFTSYYANAKVLERFGIVMVRIAQFAPRTVKAHPSFTDLAPSKDLLAKAKAGTLNGEPWAKEFKKTVLDTQIPEEAYESLQKLGKGRDVAIMCYEKNGDACHRHQVSDWLNSEGGYDVKEFPWTAMDFTAVLG